MKNLTLLSIVFLTSTLPLANPTWAATPPGASGPKASTTKKVEELLKNARREFYQARYDVALKLLEGYLEHARIGKVRPILHFNVITAIGSIYLREKQDPDGAIKFFTKIENDDRLKPAEQDIISGWISGCKEWKKLGKMPKDIKDPKELFELGKQYYEAGLKKTKFLADPAGQADFNIAAVYLVPFTVHYDKDAQIGEALFMMGDIRRRLWSDNEFWTENYYLTEVIRRFPGTSVAVRAYKALEADVHFGYSGSAGDQTPRSWIELLKDFKAMAEQGQKPAKTESEAVPN